MSDSIFLNIAVPTPTTSTTNNNDGSKKRTQAKERFKEKIKANKKGITLNPEKVNRLRQNKSSNYESGDSSSQPSSKHTNRHCINHTQRQANGISAHSKKISKQRFGESVNNKGYTGKDDKRTLKNRDFKQKREAPAQRPAAPTKEFAEVLQIDENKEQEGDVFSADRFDQIPELHPFLVSALNKSNYTTMTQIQKSSIPVLLKGKDSIIKSETGSGKTLAYLVPILNMLAKNEQKIKRGDGTYSFVLCPTRELCIQVLNTANLLLNAFVHVVAGALMVIRI